MFCKVDVRWIYVLEGTKRQRRQRGGSLSSKDAGCVLVRGPSAAAYPLPGECPRPLLRAREGGARPGGQHQPGGERANSGQVPAPRSQPCSFLPGSGRGREARGSSETSRRGAVGGRPVTSSPRGRGAPPGEIGVGGVLGCVPRCHLLGRVSRCLRGHWSDAAGAPAPTVDWRQILALCSLLGARTPSEGTPAVRRHGQRGTGVGTLGDEHG